MYIFLKKVWIIGILTISPEIHWSSLPEFSPGDSGTSCSLKYLIRVLEHEPSTFRETTFPETIMWWGVHLLANDAVLHAYIALQDLMFIIVHPFSTSMIVGRIVATLQELTQFLEDMFHQTNRFLWPRVHYCYPNPNGRNSWSVGPMSLSSPLQTAGVG